jgi:hypothetical protein
LSFFTQKNHPDRLQQHENSNASALKCSSESCQVFLNPLKTFTAVDQMMMMEEEMIECIPEIAKSAEFFRVCVPAWR